MNEIDKIQVLGIETSCDETAAAVVCGAAISNNRPGHIVSNIVLSQIQEHAAYGGVVPEIAARAHLDTLDGVIEQAMDKARVGFGDLDAVAVTSGPGLAGGLIVGTMTARALAAVHGKPLYLINHLEGHALTARLTDGVGFPYLLLLVSGGHTQILLVRGVDDYERWATTIDDALGEAFDKTAKLLGLPYPGGPQVEEAARSGDPLVFSFPRPLSGRKTMDMSYSGLKTAVRKAGLESDRSKQAVADICASFQAAVADVLEDRLSRAFEKFEAEFGFTGTLVVAGGVAANGFLRERLANLCREGNWQWLAPPHALCTDNAAMIAWAALERLRLKMESPESEGIRPRWPLDKNAATQFGAGKKGAKA